MTELDEDMNAAMEPQPTSPTAAASHAELGGEEAVVLTDAQQKVVQEVRNHPLWAEYFAQYDDGTEEMVTCML